LWIIRWTPFFGGGNGLNLDGLVPDARDFDEGALRMALRGAMVAEESDGISAKKAKIINMNALHVLSTIQKDEWTNNGICRASMIKEQAMT
jgi:hypothetical protein